MLVAAVAHVAFGQGGPPMITDDPGTPGNGKWENNLAIAFEHRPGETSYDVPAIDLNYGVGEQIQLTLQTAPVLLKRNGHGLIGGLGGTEAALKWRFVDEGKSGFDMSMFPRVIFNVAQASVRRGLAEDGTRFQIPFQAAKTFGRWHADAEFGPRSSTIGRSEWLYGVVAGYDVAKPTMLMAELHGTSRMNFDRDVLTLNFGIRQTLTERCIFIGSLGHEVHTPDGDPLAFIGYMGVQLLY
jgi:hypothetical protein